MYFIGHFWTNPVDFSDWRLHIFFLKEYKIILLHYGLRSQIIISVRVFERCILLNSNRVHVLKVSILHIGSILVNLELKVFFTGVQKRILVHCSLWSQIIRIILVSKRSFQLSSNLMSTIQITVPRTILILVYVGVSFLQNIQNVIHYGLQAQNI